METFRPTFLTILCILTFMGSAANIYNGIDAIRNPEFTASLAAEQIDLYQDQLGDDEGSEKVAEMMDKVTPSLTADNIKKIGMANIVISLINIVGAVFMWGLRKKGFYIYVVGAALGILAPYLIYGGLTGILTAGGAAFLAVILVVLYGLHLKYMY